jgi:thiosulfate/3-mercaptopyruvate sulfurtransferase
MAARLWWLLRFYGHPAIAILDGGFPRWLDESRPVRIGVEENQPAHFTGKPDPGLFVTAEEVNRVREDPAYLVIDARAGIRYRGEEDLNDPVAGHIPGAVNRFQGLNLDSHGSFLPPSLLQEQFKALIGKVPPEQVIVYCGSGVTACHHILAMEVAGMPGTRLYPGSWSEWIRDSNHLITTGDA